jgi:purine-nucleoside phosphorylase
MYTFAVVKTNVDMPDRQAVESAVAIMEAASPTFVPDCAIVLGSGWRAVQEGLGECEWGMKASDALGVREGGVSGHAGIIKAIRRNDMGVLCFLGRVHAYEGYTPNEVVRAVRAAVMMGARTVILTNAAGAVNSGLRVGDLVLLADHINLMGHSPLSGPLTMAGGNRFLSMDGCYDSKLRHAVRRDMPSVREGVYAATLGPQYETPAEVRMLRTLGVDLIGMSTVLEAIAARQLGARVVGLSFVSNVAAGLPGAFVSGEDVLAAGEAATPRMAQLLDTLLKLI